MGGATTALALLASGCGGAQRTGATATAAPAPHATGWAQARSADGAVLAYPASWAPLAGDPGTLSAAERSGGRIIGYLNLTPRQGAERAAGWAAFRSMHERAEGDRDVRVLASGPRRLSSGPAQCVKDAYTTVTGARYVELACIVEGARPAVLLGAAPPADWPVQEAVIAHAIDRSRS